MKYIIILMIVVGLACADFITGLIKAYCNSSVSSSVMRIGGAHKLGEFVVMLTFCGLDLSAEYFNRYYNEDFSTIADVFGDVSAFIVFFYISTMEIISILENYSIINPRAKWVSKLITNLKQTVNSRYGTYVDTDTLTEKEDKK